MSETTIGILRAQLVETERKAVEGSGLAMLRDELVALNGRIDELNEEIRAVRRERRLVEEKRNYVWDALFHVLDDLAAGGVSEGVIAKEVGLALIVLRARRVRHG